MDRKNQNKSARRKPSKLEQGVFLAAAFMADGYGQPDMAAEIILQHGLADHDIRNIDDYDKDRLRPVATYRGINLRFD